MDERLKLLIHQKEIIKRKYQKELKCIQQMQKDFVVKYEMKRKHVEIFFKKNMDSLDKNIRQPTILDIIETNCMNEIKQYNNGMYCCDHDGCTKKYLSMKGLRKHKRIHTDKAFTCPHCSYKGYIHSHLIEHIRTHTNERPYSCKHCNKSFKTKNVLVNHERIHEGIKPYKCNYCNKCFIRKVSLDAHIRLHTNEKPYICPQCNDPFRSSSSLRNHIMYKHENPKYKCKYPNCNKTYVTKRFLLTHYLAHENKKPFKCNLCNKYFRCKYYIKAHKKRCHS